MILKRSRLRKLGLYAVVFGIIAVLLSSVLIPLSLAATSNLNPDARSVTWGTEPLGWNTAWLTTDDNQFYKVLREQVGAGVDYEALDSTEYEAVTGSLDFGTLSDLTSYDNTYMGFYPLENGDPEQNSYDNASSSSILYGSQTAGTYLDTFEDDDTLHTIQESDEGTAATNTENNIDNNASDEGAPADVGTEGTFSNAQSDPDGTSMTLQEEDLGTTATNTENNIDNADSDEDGSGDKGTENNFNNAQSNPTGSYMDITEANQGGAGGGSEWLDVNANDSTYTAWGVSGTQPYLDSQDEPTNIISTKQEVLMGYFMFADTGLSGSGISVNFSAYGMHDDGPTGDYTYLWWGHNGSYYSTGNLAFDSTYGYKVYSITGETFTASEVNSMQFYLEYDKSGGADESYVDYVRMGTNQAGGGGDDYELDFEYQFTTLNPLDDTNEYLCIYVQATFPTENILVKIRDGAAWDQIDILDGTGWFNVSITGYLNNAQETIQFIGADEGDEGTGDTWNIGYIGIHTWTDANPDYELDFEYQFTTLNPLDDTYEELCIKINSAYPTEHLNIDIWTGSWTNINTTTGAGWCNTTITGYLDNAQETIRLVDVDKGSEDTQDTWNIGYIGIHTWTEAITDYQLSMFYPITIPDETLIAYYVNFSASRTSGGDDFTVLADGLTVGTVSDTSEAYFTVDVTAQIGDNLLEVTINDTLADDVTAQSISIDWLQVWGYTAESLDYDLEIIFGFDSGQTEADILNIEIEDESNVTDGGNIAVQIENNTAPSWYNIFNVDSVTETGHYWNSTSSNPAADLLNTTSGFRIRYYYVDAAQQNNLTIDRLNASITYQLYEYRIQVLFNFTFSPVFEEIQGFNVSDKSFIGDSSLTVLIYNFTRGGWDTIYTVDELTETAHENNTGAVDDYISGTDLISVRYLGSQGVTDYGNLTIDLLEIDIEYTISTDSEDPVISLDSPVNDTWSYVNQINLSITDANSIEAYYIFDTISEDLTDWTLLSDPYDIDVSEFDEGSYLLWVVANDSVGNPNNIFNNMKNYTIIKGEFMPAINVFEEIFYSLELWGYLGPIGLVVAGYLIARRDYKMGVLWFIIICLFTARYLELFYAVSNDYIWHIVILILGGLLTCIYPLFDR